MGYNLEFATCYHDVARVGGRAVTIMLEAI